MMRKKRQRLYFLLLSLAALGLAAGLAANAIFGHSRLVFFYGPSELAAAEIAPDQRIRIGGLVEPGSLRQGGSGTSAEISFRVTDRQSDIEVLYRGPLPDLFREGQGIVAEGTRLPDGRFRAEIVLAKHDENYMPPEVAKALKDAGRWQEGGGQESGTSP